MPIPEATFRECFQAAAMIVLLATIDYRLLANYFLKRQHQLNGNKILSGLVHSSLKVIGRSFLFKITWGVARVFLGLVLLDHIQHAFSRSKHTEGVALRMRRYNAIKLLCRKCVQKKICSFQRVQKTEECKLEVKTEQRAFSKTFTHEIWQRLILVSHRESAKSAECHKCRHITRS